MNVVGISFISGVYPKFNESYMDGKDTRRQQEIGRNQEVSIHKVCVYKRRITTKIKRWKGGGTMLHTCK